MNGGVQDGNGTSANRQGLEIRREVWLESE